MGMALSLSSLMLSNSNKTAAAGVIVGITDNFNGTQPTRSDGGSWTLLTGTAPVNSAGKLIAGAAAGTIAAPLGHQNGTYSVDVITTVGSFTPILRFASDGTAATNYMGLAIATATNAAAFGLVTFTHFSGAFATSQTSATAVFTTGVSGTVSIVVSGTAPNQVYQVKFNGTLIPGMDTADISSVPAAFAVFNLNGTNTGPDVPATGVSFDNFVAN